MEAMFFRKKALALFFYDLARFFSEMHGALFYGLARFIRKVLNLKTRI